MDHKSTLTARQRMMQAYDEAFDGQDLVTKGMQLLEHAATIAAVIGSKLAPADRVKLDELHELCSDSVEGLRDIDVDLLSRIRRLTPTR